MTQKVVVIMNFIKAFFQSESAGGISLLSAAILGVLVANSPIAAQYFAVMQIHLGPMTILEWVNDALMALFFLYVGIEIKKEMISGELDTKAKRVLPVLAAFAGVITPAIVYYFAAGYMPEYRHGWGIPTATDIAFAIGVITALGSRVPNSMKVFLTALAVIDDLIAIIVIAIFYAAHLNLFYLFAAVVVTGLLIYCNRSGYVRSLAYIILGR